MNFLVSEQGLEGQPSTDGRHNHFLVENSPTPRAQVKILPDVIILLLICPSAQPTGTGGHQIWVSINMDNIVHLTMVTPTILSPPESGAQPELLSAAFHVKS